MISAAGYVLFYALLAAMSFLVLTAVLVVIRSEHPRTNGILFTIGFLLGTTIAVVLGLLLGQAVVQRVGSHETIEGVLALLLGVTLVGAGLRKRRNPTPPVVRTDRGSALTERLRNLGPRTALPIALLLGFGGPKRLVLAFLAMATVTGAELRAGGDLTLVVLYIGVATALVTVPVGMVIVAGSRVVTAVARGESWLATNSTMVRVWATIGVGGALIVDGLLRLV